MLVSPLRLIARRHSFSRVLWRHKYPLMVTLWGTTCSCETARGLIIPGRAFSTDAWRLGRPWHLKHQQPLRDRFADSASEITHRWIIWPQHLLPALLLRFLSVFFFRCLANFNNDFAVFRQVVAFLRVHIRVMPKCFEVCTNRGCEIGYAALVSRFASFRVEWRCFFTDKVINRLATGCSENFLTRPALLLRPSPAFPRFS